MFRNGAFWTYGAIEIEFASEAQLRITGAVDTATLKAAVKLIVCPGACNAFDRPNL
jgi:hypothetical protein